MVKENVVRMHWVDAAKAIGIFFVVLGHHRDHPLYDYIYSFHMPLFFFLSGMLISTGSSSSFIDFLRKRGKALLIPYFVFSTALFLIWVLLGKWVQPSLLQGASITKNLVGIFYAQGQLEYMRWGVEMWFLPCLFLTSILFFLIEGREIKQQALLVILLALVGFALPVWLPFRLPWSIDVACIAIGFFWLGNVLKGYLINFEVGLRGASMMLLLLATNIVFHTVQGERIDMYQALYGNPFLFYVSAFAGTLFFTLLGKVVPANYLLLFLGINSLIFYMLHMRALTVINFVFRLFPGFQIDDTSLWGAVVVSALQLVILVPVVIVINRYLPFLIGKSLPSQSAAVPR